MNGKSTRPGRYKCKLEKQTNESTLAVLVQFYSCRCLEISFTLPETGDISYLSRDLKTLHHIACEPPASVSHVLLVERA